MQGVVNEHKRKLAQLEKVIAQKRIEENEMQLGGSTLTQLGSTGFPTRAEAGKEFSVEELERLRDALKGNLIMNSNKLKFLLNR